MKLTSSWSASRCKDRLCPGGRTPARIERRISLVTCSDSDRVSMGRTDPELADAIVMSGGLPGRVLPRVGLQDLAYDHIVRVGGEQGRPLQRRLDAMPPSSAR